MAPSITIALDNPEGARKNHFIYDELGNITEQYHGPYDLADGVGCWKRIFAYENGKLVSTQDIYDAWNSDWDIE